MYRRTLVRDAIAAALLVLHVLAAARAFVPGMCQTLEAAKDGAATCCASACRVAPDKTRTQLMPRADAHPPCPFCHLVCTAAHTAPGAPALHCIRASVQRVTLRHIEAPSLLTRDAHPVRAPPPLVSI